MPAIAAPDLTTQSKTKISDTTLMAGLGLTSFAALLLELGLTRLFSVVLFYHFAFLAISIALLGLGAGGVFAYLLKPQLAKIETRALASRLCTVNSILIVAVLEIVLHVPVALDVAAKNFFRLSVLYLAAAIPFFVTGLLFSVIFARETRRIPRLYGADLCGGALACLAIVPLLNWLGGPNAILVSGIALACAGMLWADTRRARKQAALLAAALVLLTAANYSGRLIDVVYAKGKFRDPAWVEFARWNALSRVEVDNQGQAKVIVIDADASTYIMNADLSRWHGTAWERALMSAPPALANVLRPHGEFAIIGPGGGVDVLRAVANGSPSVTGIEINPIIATTIMRGRYADYAQHLYQRPDVHIHVTDGRSYLRATPQNFDVVQMTLVDTWASTAAGAFALSENNLYTVEAFEEYFNHLKPDGMVAITRWEFRQPREALRVVSVAMEALHRLGIANPARNFIVAAQGPLNEDGIPVLVLAKKSSFTPQEESAVAAHLANYPALHLLYSPSAPETNPFSDLLASNDPYRFARGYGYNVSPVTDNAPFFFFTLKLDRIVNDLGLHHGIDWKVNLGSASPAAGSGDFRHCGVALLDSAPAAAAKTSALLSACLVLFRRGRAGLHSGGDRFHSAVRAVPGTPDVCLNCRHLPADALQRRRQPVLAALATARRHGLASLATRTSCSPRRRCIPPQPACCASWLGFRLSPDHQRSPPRPVGICYGHAFSHRASRAGRRGQ